MKRKAGKLSVCGKENERQRRKEIQVHVGVFRETDRERLIERESLSCLCVCARPWGITYHINNLTDCPDSSPISRQSSTFSQRYLTLNSETTLVQFKHAAPV